MLETDDFQFFADSADDPKRMLQREVQCHSCFALYKNPCYSRAGFKTLFAEAGRSYGSDRSVEQVGWLRERSLLNPGASVLDIGCYEGRFLSEIASTVSRSGVDIDRQAIERGREQFRSQGMNLIAGDFESFEFDGVADTVTMFHVLEHLSRPLATLQRLRELAHARTRLVVEVPVLENGATDDVNGFMTPQHLTHFSRRSLDNVLERSGWETFEHFEARDYNGRRVIAEPAASSHTRSGDPNDVTRVYEYLAGWYKSLAGLNERLQSLEPFNRCVIWGAGFHTECLYQRTLLFRQRPDREYVIVDGDPTKHHKSWRGISIGPPTWLRSGIDWATTVLVVSSYGSQDSIADASKDFDVPADRILRLYGSRRVY